MAHFPREHLGHVDEAGTARPANVGTPICPPPASSLTCTGPRIAELASLCWSDIDPGSGRLTRTDETGRSTSSDQQPRTTKSGRNRSFPVHRDLRTVLERTGRLGRYVFHGPRGGRLKPDTVRRILIRDVIFTMRRRSVGGTAWISSVDLADGPLARLRITMKRGMSSRHVLR